MEFSVLYADETEFSVIWKYKSLKVTRAVKFQPNPTLSVTLKGR